MGCTISDFRDKEVINVCDGRRLGFVIDVEFDITSGKILSIVLPGTRGSLFCFGKTEDFCIEWCKIQRIGDDIILVDIGNDVSSCRCDCNGKPKRKFF